MCATFILDSNDFVGFPLETCQSDAEGFCEIYESKSFY